VVHEVPETGQCPIILLVVFVEELVKVPDPDEELEAFAVFVAVFFLADFDFVEVVSAEARATVMVLVFDVTPLVEVVVLAVLASAKAPSNMIPSPIPIILLSFMLTPSISFSWVTACSLKKFVSICALLSIRAHKADCNTPHEARTVYLQVAHRSKDMFLTWCFMRPRRGR
jgi:hypothetical protein